MPLPLPLATVLIMLALTFRAIVRYTGTLLDTVDLPCSFAVLRLVHRPATPLRTCGVWLIS